MKKTSLSVLAFAALIGFSSASYADAWVWCTSPLSRVTVNQGILGVTHNNSDVSLCSLEEKETRILPAPAGYAISQAQCQAWHSSLLTAFAHDKPVTLGYMLPATKSCDAFGVSENYKIVQVYINKQ